MYNYSVKDKLVKVLQLGNRFVFIADRDVAVYCNKEIKDITKKDIEKTIEYVKNGGVIND